MFDFNRDKFSDVTSSKMKNIYHILLSVALWDTCNCVANYVVAREGKNVSLSFNLTYNETTTIMRKGENIFKFKGMKFLRVFDNSYTERVQYDPNQTAGGLFNFTLLNVTSSDAGQFKHKDFDESGEYLLLVISREPTRPEVEGDSTSLVAGSQMNLTCNSTSKSLPSNHPLVMEYRWKKNGNDVETQANLPYFTLNVRKDNRGDNYSCQAYEEGLDSPWSLAFKVQPQYGPDSIQIYPTSVIEGEPVTCSADCNPDCNITWTDGQVATGQVRFSIDRGQSGIYCTAWNVHGNKSKSVDVRVLSPADATVVITVVNITIILVLILLTSGLVICRRRKRTGQRRYRPHGTCNTTRNNIFRQEYATVPRKTDRPAKDVYAKVKKGKPIVCKNKVYDGAGNLSREALIVRRASPSGEGALNNCGERNEDGLIYADLDLLPPTLKNGSPVIIGTREETVYVDIDFTKTPGPQLPDKIWEVEKK